jgi:hypothetical protein
MPCFFLGQGGADAGEELSSDLGRGAESGEIPRLQDRADASGATLGHFETEFNVLATNA